MNMKLFYSEPKRILREDWNWDKPVLIFPSIFSLRHYIKIVQGEFLTVPINKKKSEYRNGSILNSDINDYNFALLKLYYGKSRLYSKYYTKYSAVDGYDYIGSEILNYYDGVAYIKVNTVKSLVLIKTPKYMNVEDGMLHCNTGPAIEFVDGIKFYYLENEQISKEFIHNPTVEHAMKFKGSKRYVALKQVGVKKLLADGLLEDNENWQDLIAGNSMEIVRIQDNNLKFYMRELE